MGLIQLKKTIGLIIFFFLPFYIFSQEIKALDNVNSSFRETNLSITPNGKYLFFMSTRGGQPWSTAGYPDPVSRKVGYDGDIWYATKSNGKWKKPVVLPRPFNTSLGEDEPSISADGQKVYFQSWRNDWMVTGGPYYQAELDGQKWKAPVGLGGNITRFFANQERVFMKYVQSNFERTIRHLSGQLFFGTDGMAVSPDGKIFIVSVTMYNQGYRNFELYISRKNSSGQWSYPKPLSVNTSKDEISVFIAGDNKTLYFASNGRKGLGGYDIFKTTLEGGTQCGAVTNLGSPYNTRSDDYSFIVNSLGTNGYLVRNGQIYEVDLNEKAKATPTLVINGVVKDQAGKFLNAAVQLIETSSSKKLGLAKSNGFSGDFSFSVPWKEGTKKLLASLDDGRQQAVEFTINNNSSNPQYQEIIFPSPEIVETSKGAVDEPKPTLDQSLQEKKEPKSEPEIEKKLDDPELKVNETFKVDNLYFDADTSKIISSSYPALNQLASALINRPGIIVEIGGHTNGLPPHYYCDQLSKARAKAVFDYLVKKGVPSNRLQYKGYGKRQPIATNETLAGRKKNQRVELKILEIRK